MRGGGYERLHGFYGVAIAVVEDEANRTDVVVNEHLVSEVEGVVTLEPEIGGLRLPEGRLAEGRLRRPD